MPKKKAVNANIRPWYDMLTGLLFPSKENDGIEHVDESYEEFCLDIESALTEAYEAGRGDGYDAGYLERGEEVELADEDY